MPERFESISYCLMHFLIVVFTLCNLDIMFLEYNVSAVLQVCTER